MIMRATPSLQAIVKMIADESTRTSNLGFRSFPKIVPGNLEPPAFNDRKRTTQKDRTAIVANEMDLVRLGLLVSSLSCLKVLEFGCGYSTIALARALQENQMRADLRSLVELSRQEKPFHVHSVDASRHFIRRTKRMLRSQSLTNATLSFSSCRAAQFAESGGVCSEFRRIPNVTPDLIYIDAPALHQIKGSVKGLSFNLHSRSPVASDLVVLEPLLRPGVVVVLDGQTSTVRALLHHLRRTWGYVYCSETDGHYLELMELPLGKAHAEVLSKQRGTNWEGEVKELI